MEDELRATRQLIFDLQNQVKFLTERILTPELGSSNLAEKLQSKESKDEDTILRSKASIPTADVAVGHEIPSVRTDHINANGVLDVDLHKSDKAVSDVKVHKSDNCVADVDLHKSDNHVADVDLHKSYKGVSEVHLHNSDNRVSDVDLHTSDNHVSNVNLHNNHVSNVDLHKSDNRVSDVHSHKSCKGVSELGLHKSDNRVMDVDWHKSDNRVSDVDLHKSDNPVIDMDVSSGAGIKTMLVDLTQHFTTDEVFETRSELVNWCKEVGMKLNTVVITLLSHNDTPIRKGRLHMGCERSGPYRKFKRKGADEGGSKKRKRNFGTKKCNCPFMLKGIPVDGDRWILKVISGFHNHPLIENLDGHAYAARLNEEEKKILVDMSLSGVKPKEILTTLKKWNENNRSTARTIYNARTKMKIIDTEGRAILQQLMKHLTKKHYVHWYEKDSLTDDLQLIFWAHPESIMFAKSFPSVLMIDCTYKAKRSKMPLLHVSGVTSIGRSFCVALAFISSEREENYVWTLKNLKRLFDPNQLPQVFITYRDSALMKAISDVFSNPKVLLCTSHINMNVEAHVKKNLGTAEQWDRFSKDWTAVTQATTETEFNDLWEQFKITWAAFPEDIYYLELVWLRHKENFVWAWTNNIKHFGNYTNRIDGAHGRLKKHLDSLQSGIETLWGPMYNTFTLMFNDLKTGLLKTLGHVKHSHNIPAFRDLRTHVSQYAMDLIVQEITRAEEVGFNVSICRHVLRTAYGLPCAHELMEYKAEGRPIPLNAVDAQWKQLSGIPNMVVHDELDYEPEMQLFKKRWTESTNEEKCAMVCKLKEICTPTVTNMNEPIAEQNTIRTRGRPKGSTKKKAFQEHENSTKSEPSAEQLKSDIASCPMLCELKEICIPTVTNLNEPKREQNMIRRRGRPKGSAKKKVFQEHENSTKREPSAEQLNSDIASIPMLCRLEEICTSTLTNLNEPKMEQTTIRRRGRPKGSTKKKAFQEHENSTKSEPSAEQLNSDIASSPIQKKAELATQSQPSKAKTSFPLPEDMLRYITALPRVLQSFIGDIQDVPSDGNCGYRTIALSKGWTDDMSWMRVRTDLIREIDAHSIVYNSMFGDHFSDQFRRTLNCFDSPCTNEYWMVMPEMGYLIASTYNIVLVFISDDQCLTFLPLREAPRPREQHNIVSVGLVNRLHFVRLVMKADFPIPPIASFWYSFSTPEAKEWLTSYEERIKRFQEIIPSDITTMDFIDSFGESMPQMK